ncbi:MAG: nucleoside hydrolase [Spirochaetaceae bacterium]|nr:nucleoside hydrolase [Spirochaetaceae bacterium]
MRTIILDTDIGNDVDDIFALIILAKAKELRLLGVTTVYGDTVLQARMTRFVLDKLGRIDIPVVPGEGTPLSGGPILRGDHVAGGFPACDLANVRSNVSIDAADYLIEQSKLHEGQLEIFAIGPLTNISLAIQRDSGFSGRIKHLTLMGGMIYPDRNPVWLEIISRHDGEYNIACDQIASNIVFDSPIPKTLIPLDVTTTVAFTPEHRDYFARMPHGLGEILAKELDIWWNVTSRIEPAKDCRSNPHDPMAAICLFDESYYSFKQGQLSIGSSHGLNGMTLFQEDENGPDRVALTVKKDILKEVVARVIK